MATFGPASDDTPAAATASPTRYASVRLLIQQRALGTLAHELGNLTSPVELVADVIAAGNAAHGTAAAGTLRLVATSLARATTVCRLLRSNGGTGALAPATITDTAAWWTLCAPFASDMLPDTARVTGSVQPVPLGTVQYEALLWATLALAAYIGVTRPALVELMITGTSGRGAFALRVDARAPRGPVADVTSRQLLSLAAWEARRAGGRLRISDAEACEGLLTLPVRAHVPLS